MTHVCLCGLTDRGLVSVDGNVVHLVEVVVQEALLRVGLDDLAQGFPAQLLGGQSWRLAVQSLWRPERGRDRVEERGREGKQSQSQGQREKEKDRNREKTEGTKVFIID